MEEVVAGEEVLLLAILVQAAVGLVMSVAARTLEGPRCCKAPRGPAPVQCYPNRPLSLAMWLGWAWGRRGRTRLLCLRLVVTAFC